MVEAAAKAKVTETPTPDTSTANQTPEPAKVENTEVVAPAEPGAAPNTNPSPQNADQAR